MTIRTMIETRTVDDNPEDKPVFLKVNNLWLKAAGSMPDSVVFSYGSQDFGWCVAFKDLEDLVELGRAVRKNLR